MLKKTLVLLVAVLAVSCLASAQTHNLAPVTSFSVHDEPLDGIGDSYNTTHTGLIRYQSHRADRAMQEYDVQALAGASVTSATISGKVSVNNAYDNGVRTFDFLLYSGNGAPDLSDYQIAATVVGKGSYHPPIDTSFTFSFDVTSHVQSLITGGATHIGLRAEATSNPNFPNILGVATAQLVIVTGGAPLWTDLGNSLPGTLGAPVLVGQGSLVAGTAVSLNLSTALPLSSATLIMGAQNISLPFMGGTLVPSPDVLIFGIPIISSGEIAISTTTPPGIPSGVPLFFQYWINDPVGPVGLSASNAVTVVTP